MIGVRLVAMLATMTLAIVACGTPASPPAAAGSPVEGVVIDIVSSGFGTVDRFTLRLAGGATMEFTVGQLEEEIWFPASHLVEMRALALPIQVFFREEGDGFVAYRFEHVDPMAGVSAPPATAPAGTTDSSAIQAVPVSASIWSGGTTVMFVLEDARNQPIDDATAVVTVIAHDIGEGGTPAPDATGLARALVIPSSGRLIHAVDLQMGRAGPWQLEVEVRSASGSGRTTLPLTVVDSGDALALGAPAPAVHTPTAADVNGNLSLIVGPPFADLRFYDSSIDTAIDRGEPFVVVLDSSKWRTSVYCGTAISMVQQVARRWPELTFIHVEPFATTLIAGSLVLDPPEGATRFSATAEAFGLGGTTWPVESSPWIFVVGADGRIAARFQGIVGSDELEATLVAVSGG